MTEFRTLENPEHLGWALQALWHDARGDWDRAHTLCQTAHSREGDWVHAYLHRKEGDRGNANYWYGRADQEPPGREISLAAEWEQLVTTLLAREG